MLPPVAPVAGAAAVALNLTSADSFGFRLVAEHRYPCMDT